MISLKSAREIDLMDHAGNIVALVHQKMKEVIVPGISTYEIDKIAEKLCFNKTGNGVWSKSITGPLNF